MSDDHLMKNIIAQAEIIKELQEENKVMREALYIIERNYGDGQSLSGTDCSAIAVEALSKVKLTK